MSTATKIVLATVGASVILSLFVIGSYAFA